jgi:TnpA family transposase
MPSPQDTAYPRLKSNPTEKDLMRLYTPTLEELNLARRVTRNSATRLNFLILLKTFQRLGYGIALARVPARIIRHLVTSAQLPMTEQDLSRYDTSATRKRHLPIVRDYLQITTFGQKAHETMIQALEMAVLAKHDLVDLINIAIEELVRQRFELPGFSTLERTARAVRKAHLEQLYEQVSEALTSAERQQLASLFSEGDDGTPWERLKQEPGKPLLSRLKDWTERLQWLAILPVSSTALAGIPPVKVQQFAAEAQTLDAARMNALPLAKQETLAVALLTQHHGQTLDDVTEMFIKRMRQLHCQAREALLQHRLESQARAEALIAILRDIIVAYQLEDGVLQRFAAIAAVIGEHPEQFLEQCEAYLAEDSQNYFAFLPKFYRSHRALLFRLIEILILKPSASDTRLLEAIAFIKCHRTKRGTWLPITGTAPPEAKTDEPIVLLDIRWVPQRWWALVTGQAERQPTPTQVHRIHFELCVFSHLLLEVQSGDLYIEGSQEYGDYFSQLISWPTYHETVAEYGAIVGLPVQPQDFVQHVKAWLSTQATHTDQSFPANTKVTYQKEQLVIQRYHRHKPADLPQLESLLAERLRPVHLLDVLTDTEFWLNWTRFFKPISGYEAKLDDPTARYLVTTFCYGCNVGPSQTARSLEALDRRQVSWVHRRHISEAGLQAAITTLIDAYNQFALPKFWGSGQRASVDGTKWDMYEQNLLAEYHIRYGGYGGIGYYQVSDTYIALFSHFIPCGVWEAVYILDGLLNNTSEIQPDTIHGDTQAQSATVFALADLLGITLMPRIRNWQDLAFLRPTHKAKYQHIDSLFSGVVNWTLIEEYLPDMLRVAMSVKVGKIKASTILRKLGTNSRKNKLFQAFHELGTALRTGFLLQYLNDEDLRATIQAATNKSESFNRFAKWLAFGGEGVIPSNDRDEQRKFIKYNHLVANCLIFYNVFEMSRILHELMQAGYTFSEAAIASLSPYLTEHINRLGRYHLDLERRPPAIQFDVPIVSATKPPQEEPSELTHTAAEAEM